MLFSLSIVEYDDTTNLFLRLFQNIFHLPGKRTLEKQSKFVQIAHINTLDYFILYAK